MVDPSPVRFLLGVGAFALLCIFLAAMGDLLFGRHDWPGEDE